MDGQLVQYLGWIFGVLVLGFYFLLPPDCYFFMGFTWDFWYYIHIIALASVTRVSDFSRFKLMNVYIGLS